MRSPCPSAANSRGWRSSLPCRSSALVAYQIYRQFEGDATHAAEAVQRVARAAAAETRRTLDETERMLKRLAEHESAPPGAGTPTT
jgi:hypothetical protein